MKQATSQYKLSAERDALLQALITLWNKAKTMTADELTRVVHKIDDARKNMPEEIGYDENGDRFLLLLKETVIEEYNKAHAEPWTDQEGDKSA